MISECHAHIFMNGCNYPEAKRLYTSGSNRLREEDIRSHLEAYRRNHVAYVRDGGDPYGACTLARKLAPEYGIEYRIPVFAIHQKGRYGAIVGRSFETLKDYSGLVQEAASQGADFVKVMFSGIMDFSGDGGVTGEPAADELIREMIHIAHEEGFAVMAHVNGDAAVRSALLAGVDSIEHGNFMQEETLQLLAESETVWVPTNVTIHNLLGSGRFDDALIEKLDAWQTRNIRLAFAYGARVAAGSDAGAFCVQHGKGILEERCRIREITGNLKAGDAWLAAGDAWLRSRFCRK